jgi:hypothetical protein
MEQKGRGMLNELCLSTKLRHRSPVLGTPDSIGNYVTGSLAFSPLATLGIYLSPS